MPKRESEDGQMRREDYEAKQNRRGGGSEVTEGFERADESVRAKRRIVSARRPKSTSGKTGAFANVSLTGQGQTPGGKFSFGGATSMPATTSKLPSTTLNFGSPTPAPAAAFSFGSTATSPAPAPSTAAFSFGSSSTPAPAPGPSVGFSFSGATPAPAPVASTAGATPAPFGFGKTPGSSGGSSGGSGSGGFGGGFGGPTGGFGGFGGGPSSGGGGSSGSSLAQKFQKHACSLEQSFFDQCKKVPIIHTEMLALLDRHLDHTYVLEDEYWKRVPKEGKPEAASKESTAGQTPFVSAKDSSSGTPGSLFGGTSTSKATPASTGGGLFGGATPDTGSSKPFGSGAFSFAGTPGPVSFGTAAPPPGGDAEDATQGDTTASLETGTADQDYTTLKTLDLIHVFNKEKKLLSGMLKVQEHNDSKKRRLIMRDPSSGKVLLNMSLPAEVTFSNQPNKKGQDIETGLCIGKITPDHQAELIRFRRGVGPVPSVKDFFAGVGVNCK